MKWLHISDLHYNPAKANFDTKQLLSKLISYIGDHNIAVDEIFFTGDFRFAEAQEATIENARLAAKKLIEIADIAGVRDAIHIHIVPGNHDLEWGDAFLFNQANEQYNHHGEYAGHIIQNNNKIRCIDYLSSRFQFFLWIAAELNNGIWINSLVDLKPINIRTGKIGEKFNVIYLNTALGCGQNVERTQLRVGYEYIAKTIESIDAGIPTIVLGHHGLGCMARKERERIKEILNQKNVKLYLCGDEHIGGIDEYGTMLQLTAGCLNQEEKGIEPTFYIGEMEDNGSFEVNAYTYQSGAYTGWSRCEPICDRISKITTRMFPRVEDRVFGRKNEIKGISELVASPRGKIVEVWGVAGVGKTTVCHEVLKCVEMAHISVDTRLYNTTTEIQRNILLQLGIDVDNANIAPNDYGDVLVKAAKKTRKLLYLDNAETPIIKNRALFSSWLLSFAHESGWRVMYSTQIQLDSEHIESIALGPLPNDDAFRLFKSRRWKSNMHLILNETDKQLAYEIAVDLLSRHPLAIVLATSSKHNKRTLFEIKSDLQKRIHHQFIDDMDAPHRSMSAALAMTVIGIESDKASELAKELWSVLAQYAGEFNDDLFSLAYDNNTEYSYARLVLREYALIGEQNYAMLEPIKAEAINFSPELITKSRNVLFNTIKTLFDKGRDKMSPDRQKWHEVSVSCLEAALELLASANLEDYKMERFAFQSMYNYFQFSSNKSLIVLHNLVELFRDEQDNLGLANVLQAMGDLERYLGQIDAAKNHYEQAEQLYRDERYNLGLANVLLSMGDLERRLGQIDAAKNHYEQAEQLSRDERYNLGLAFVLLYMVVLEISLGQIDAAKNHYKQVEQLYRDEQSNLGFANMQEVMIELNTILNLENEDLFSTVESP